MSKYTRGEFLGLAGLAAGAIVGGGLYGQRRSPTGSPTKPSSPSSTRRCSPSTTPGPAPRRSRSRRAIPCGRCNADIRNLVTARTTVIDGAGATVLPGFIDTHNHPSGVNELFGQRQRAKQREFQAAMAKRRDHAARLLGERVHVRRHQVRRACSSSPLDEVGSEPPGERKPPRRPHELVQLHGAQAGQIDRNSPIRRGDRSCATIAASRPAASPSSRATRSIASGRARRSAPRSSASEREKAWRTSPGCSPRLGSPPCTTRRRPANKIRAYQDLPRGRAAPSRLQHAGRRAAGIDKAAGIYTGFGDEWVRVGGVKFVADGPASERTMLMSTPYVGRRTITAS